MVERKTLNLVVVGSIPTVGVSFFGTKAKYKAKNDVGEIRTPAGNAQAISNRSP